MFNGMRRSGPAVRQWLVALGVSLLFVAGAYGTAADEAPLIDLDAAALSAGPVAAWPNAGALGGEFISEAKAAPTAGDIAGRRAVTFGDGHYLGSSFKVPAQLTGGHPFTVAVWAFAPGALKRDVLVSLASRPLNTAEFGWGPGPDGAFFGWDKSAKFTRMPDAGRWHYIVYTYSAEAFHLYVDGALDAQRTFALAPKPNGKIYLGAGWNATDQKPAFPFHGSLARVQIWDRALTLRELRNAAEWYDCFAPVPADRSTVMAESTILKWEAGRARAASYTVKLATDEATAQSDAVDSKDLHADAAEVHPRELVPGRTYFWRVDQFDAQGKRIEKGNIWRFMTDNGPATLPVPRDRIASVPPDLKALGWKPGRYAVTQTLYFGTDREAVANGSALLAKRLSPATTSYAIPSKLESGKTYYWRVSEENGSIAPAAGEVWAFRTIEEPVADDVTFFVGSDCHYGLGNNDELNRRVIDEMDFLPGTALPKKAGAGYVRTPRAVVLDGDLLDKGFEPKVAVPAWAEFVQDYGLTGSDGRLAYPVYEGFGNHDGMTGKSISREGIRQRNKQRPGLTMVSANGYHYSWDWDQMHGVQLNLFPGKDSADCIVGPPNHHPEDALGFLKEDLAKNVTDRNRIVVIFCHYCYTGGMADWWTDAAKERFFEALKSYRVVLIHGHSHGAYFYTWKGLPVISDGATARPEGQTGDFLVVRMTKDQLMVAQRKMGEWGIAETIPLPAAAGSEVSAHAKP